MEINNANSHRIMLDQIYTLHELQIYLRSLKTAENLRFEQSINFFEGLRNTLPSLLMKYLQDYAESNKINLQNQEQVLKLSVDLVNYLESIPVVELTFPIDLTYRQIIKICKWWRTNSNDAVVVNIKINPELLSGLTIAFKGKYFDYSLNRWLEHEGAVAIAKLLTPT